MTNEPNGRSPGPIEYQRFVSGRDADRRFQKRALARIAIAALVGGLAWLIVGLYLGSLVTSSR